MKIAATLDNVSQLRYNDRTKTTLTSDFYWL